MRQATILRDSIWGDIDLRARELALIDTPAFQRLRRVRQLGFTDLVFPGAHHNRFEHSLGVLHLANQAIDRLRGITDLPPQEVRSLQAAALLHDIGHYPFSHAVEELEVAQVRDHEDIAAEIITSAPIADILRREWEVDPSRVAWLVAGEDAAGSASNDERLLRPILNSGLDVDKLDYLVRDARAANVPYGMVDVQRLLHCLTVSPDERGAPRLAIDAKGVSALQSLVFAKYLMFATVYWHHACRAAVVMLLRALQEALDAGALDPKDLERADDASLIALLRSDAMPSLTRELGQRLLDRQLYKRAFELGIDEPPFAHLERLWRHPEQRRAVEDGWATRLGLPAGSILIDIPEPRAIGRDLPPVVELAAVRAWDQVSGLESRDLARFERWARKIRAFATDPDAAARAGARQRDLLTTSA